MRQNAQSFLSTLPRLLSILQAPAISEQKAITPQYVEVLSAEKQLWREQIQYKKLSKKYRIAEVVQQTTFASKERLLMRLFVKMACYELFSEFDTAHMDDLVSELSLVRCKDGESIKLQNCVYIVVQGALRHNNSDTVKVGESIGAQNFLSESCAKSDLEAVGDTILYHLPKLSFLKVLKQYRQERCMAYEAFLKSQVLFTLPEYTIKEMSHELLE